MSCAEKTHKAVHFARKAGHVWLCVECGTQLGGTILPEDERIMLVEFAKHCRVSRQNKQTEIKKKFETKE